MKPNGYDYVDRIMLWLNGWTRVFDSIIVIALINENVEKKQTYLIYKFKNIP